LATLFQTHFYTVGVLFQLQSQLLHDGHTRASDRSSGIIDSRTGTWNDILDKHGLMDVVDITGSSSDHTYHKGEHSSRIDYTVVSSNYAGLIDEFNVWKDDSVGADHVPIELVMNTEWELQHIKRIHRDIYEFPLSNSEKWNEYYDLLENYLPDPGSRIDCFEDLNRYTQVTENAFIEASKEIFLTKSGITDSVVVHKGEKHGDNRSIRRLRDKLERARSIGLSQTISEYDSTWITIMCKNYNISAIEFVSQVDKLNAIRLFIIRKISNERGKRFHKRYLKWAMKVRLSEITNPRFFWRACSVKLTDRIQPRGVRGDNNTVVRDAEAIKKELLTLVWSRRTVSCLMLVMDISCMVRKSKE
jgi:hypothetical protein